MNVQSRPRALARSGAQGIAAAELLDLIEERVQRGKRLWEIPLERIAGVLGSGDLERLRGVDRSVRRRIASDGRSAGTRAGDVLVAMRLLDMASGGHSTPPTPGDCEVACPGCGWPSLFYCRLCKAHYCGRERCSPQAPPEGPQDRYFCSHPGANGDTFSAIRNDEPPNLPRPTTTRRSAESPAVVEFVPGEGWRQVGEVRVDSGRVGVAPLGGGKGVGCDTGVGDGVFVVEARVEGPDRLELRILLAPGGPTGGRWSSAGSAASRSGLFVVVDPKRQLWSPTARRVRRPSGSTRENRSANQRRPRRAAGGWATT